MRAAIICLALSFMAVGTGCAYGHSLRVGKNKVMVLRNDGFLFGALRQAKICEVGAKGLKNCSSDENP